LDIRVTNITNITGSLLGIGGFPGIGLSRKGGLPRNGEPARKGGLSGMSKHNKHTEIRGAYK